MSLDAVAAAVCLQCSLSGLTHLWGVSGDCQSTHYIAKEKYRPSQGGGGICCGAVDREEWIVTYVVSGDDV